MIQWHELDMREESDNERVSHAGFTTVGRSLCVLISYQLPYPTHQTLYQLFWNAKPDLSLPIHSQPHFMTTSSSIPT